VGDVALSNREKRPIYGYHDRKDDYRIVDHDNDDYDQHRRQGVTNRGKGCSMGKIFEDRRHEDRSQYNLLGRE